jgi:hypothetical protein
MARLTGIAMKNVSVENAFRWILAASMLLATTVTSSTYVHDHGGGSLSHQHGKSDGTISHCFTPTTLHDDHDASVSRSACEFHGHGCLMLFGLPLPGEPSGSHQKLPNGWETIVTVSAAQTIRAPSKSLLGSHFGLASQAVLATGCVCEWKQLEHTCNRAAPAFPLCDRARQERSGVLLA